MFRSWLLQKSAHHYARIITGISKMDPVLWEIDVDKYDSNNIWKLLDCKEEINDLIMCDGETHRDITLTTKIMLGVFGNIPAFDQFFTKSFKVPEVNKETLGKIRDIYLDNKRIIDETQINTLDFITGKETSIRYPKAKLIDMYGFVRGQLQSKNKNKKHL
jgi:hypothetical protein